MLRDELKELGLYQKKLLSVNEVERKFREEMLEFLYTIAYPQGKSGSKKSSHVEVPAI